MISSQSISKSYLLGEQNRAGYRTLRETLSGQLERPARALRRLSGRVRGKQDDRRSDRSILKALDGVSFEIKEGEAVGVIGHNGAGKSTLLKVLSRITEPTSGRVEMVGRVGSLLEVGTGFHPELTGRENIFLNGAILGMPHREVQRSFDQIVDFAEIESFLDTPVKRYSSGMYVRLAFSVAAHMQPDILLIDEVLAVGDLKFQRKCMEHAKSLLKTNATVLLVSHNMFAVRTVCSRALYLDHGRLAYDGPVDRAIGLYETNSQLQTPSWAEAQMIKENGLALIELTSIESLDEQGVPRASFSHGERMRVRVGFEVPRPLSNPNFIVAIVRSDNVNCCNYNTVMDDVRISSVSGRGEVELLTPPLNLVSDSYSLHVLVRDEQFQRLYCAKIGPAFQVRDELLSTHFGVFHEPGSWAVRC